MDYTRMTKEELIRNLRKLENRTRDGVDHPSSSSARRRLTESALRDSEERIRAILNTAVEGIITIDQSGLIESANPSTQKMFGYTEEELLGRNVSLLMPEPYRSQHDTYLQNYLKSGKAKIIGIGREVVGRRKDGTVFPMDLSVGEVKLAGGARLFTGIARDITERKRAEVRLEELANTLVEKNKELETVVYVASHDLRSPLVNIQGFSRELSQACAAVRARLDSPEFRQLAQEDIGRLLSEEIPEAIGYILAGVAKMDALLNGFLRFSRLGRASLEIRRLDMNEMIATIVTTMEYEIKQSGADVEIGDLPPCYGDPTQINQVFTNLLSNALKYLDPARKGEIAVTGEREGPRSIYRVQDNGVGIAQDHQRKIFEIFHRLNPGQTDGEGIGLSIAQKILERHRGRIWIESVPGEGSAFFVSIPNQAI